MNLKEMYARHLVELGYLEEIMNELSYPTQLIERSPEIPYHTLIASLDHDSKNRVRELACTFYPLSEKEANNVLLLQYFLELPFEIQEQAYPELYELFTSLNNKSVLGHFSITEGKPKIHHRYIQTVPRDTLLAEVEEATAEIITLFNYTSLMLGDMLEAVASQERSAKEAIEML